MRNNKFWMAAMIVTVSMVSCSLEEVVEQPASQAIGFSPFVGKPTRAVTEIISPSETEETGEDALSTFYVFGRYGASSGTYDKEVYNNAEVTVSSDNYTNVGPTDNVQYWVPNKYYKFAAYSDGNSQINGTDGNSPTVSFDNNGNITISNYSADTKDLILATPAQVSTGTTISSQPGAVSLTFKHLLSQVSFQFKGEEFPADYKIKIENLKFSVNNTATYTGSSSSWGTPATSATKSYTVNSGSSFAFGTATKSDANFVIPQSYSSDIKATFKATIYDNHGSEVATKDFETVSLLDNTAAANSGGTPSIPSQWEAGYRYQYNLTITPSNMGNMYPIEFTVTSVEGWQDKETNGYDTGIEGTSGSN